MGDKSSIEWTDATWNPIRGCSRVSEGCRNCYAERTAIRQAGIDRKGGGAYAGLVKSTRAGPRWTGDVRFVPEALDLPLKWKTPRRVFVNSMSDLFHEKVLWGWLVDIFHVMRTAERHTFQVLTKRADRMADLVPRVLMKLNLDAPPPNVWLGTSVENQETADQRIQDLLQTPAAVRFLSVEPLLGPVDLSTWLLTSYQGQQIGWVIVGGESGPGARPCDVAWIRSVVQQCKAASVPVFVKQLGAQIRGDGVGFSTIHHWIRRDGAGRFLAPLIGPNVGLHPSAPGWEDADFRLCDAKGGNPDEWPVALRVREFPPSTI